MDMKRYFDHRQLYALLIVLMLCFCVTGCTKDSTTGEPLPADQQAVIVVYNLGEAYTQSVALYNDLLKITPVDKQTVYILEIDPVFIKAGTAIISANKAVTLWQETKNKPGDMDKLLSNATELITQIKVTLTRFGVKNVN